MIESQDTVRLGAAERFTHVDVLARRLGAGSLPGQAAQRRMAAMDRAWMSHEAALAAGCREACTAVLVYPHPESAGSGDGWQVVLTRRGADLRDHAGQISFPGGRLEAGESREACALRELEEELAVPASQVSVLGELTGLYIPPSNFWVYPLLLAAPERPAFRPQRDEVAEVLEIPLLALLQPEVRRSEMRELHGVPRLVPYWAFGGHKVWGATAMILAELASLWSELGGSDLPTRSSAGSH